MPSDPSYKALWQALADGLREHGWEEGLNFIFEARFSGPDPARFSELAAELAALKVDVIISGQSQAIEAARRATTTIPIIMAGPADPVGSGFVVSLARPGGNITGIANQIETVSAKNLELLRDYKPGIQRVGIIYATNNVPSAKTVKTMQEEVAPRLGLLTLPSSLAKPEDLTEALATIVRGRAEALLVLPVPIAFSLRFKISTFAIEQRLPTTSPAAYLVRDGLLMGYGFDSLAIWRRVGSYVDRVFKGANPADLPVEQVDRFQFTINMKTARAIGFEVSPALLSRADEVID